MVDPALADANAVRLVDDEKVRSAVLVELDSRTKPGEARANDQDVEFVHFKLIFYHRFDYRSRFIFAPGIIIS